MADKLRVSMQINGRTIERDTEARVHLGDFLRQELDLTGTHLGCEHGVCGACTVIVNGAAIRACLMLAVQADGCDVRTIEGFAEDGFLHPVQQAFWERHGLQCGFCTPGMLATLIALLEEDPDRSEEDIRDAISGHICRCTGYQAIVAAGLDAAAVMAKRKPLA
jgi:aerobic-type carbon monoxide dehydrogenase small subunit (CoxS/CutS family)